MKEDSINGMKLFQIVRKIIKMTGGIGLHIHNIRSSNSYIRGTGGKSNGIVPMLGI